jgi:hypothetical protein
MEQLNGTKIINVAQYFEHITVNTADGSRYFIDPKLLVVILSEFDYLVEKKRTRSYLHLDIDDYKIEKVED